MISSVDIIGVSAFGKDFQTLYNSDNRLASVYKKAFDPTPDIIRYFATSMVLPPFMGRWIPMSGNRKITVDSMVMKEQCAQLIAENRAALKESGDGRPDILSLLLKTDLSDEEILDQMLTFLAAG
jgi:cytochrome P450